MKNPHFAGDLRKRVHISLLLDVALAFHFALIERVTHRTTIVSLSQLTAFFIACETP